MSVAATYLVAVMALTGISLMLTVAVIHIHHQGPDTPLPPMFRSLTFNIIARLVGKKGEVEKVEKAVKAQRGDFPQDKATREVGLLNDSHVKDEVISVDSSREWVLAAKIWDRLFIAFCFTCLMLVPLITLVLLPLGRPTKVEPERIS